MLHSGVGSRLYLRILDKAGKACQNRQSDLLQAFLNYSLKQFITLGPVQKISRIWKKLVCLSKPVKVTDNSKKQKLTMPVQSGTNKTLQLTTKH